MRQDNLRRLLWTMSGAGTFYVLGSGTSAGLVPFTDRTLAFVRQRYVEIGEFAVDREPSPLMDRLVIAPMLAAWGRGQGHPDDFLVEHIPFAALELLAQKAWSPRLDGPTPPQYSLLQWAAAPAIIFSFNLDGFARSYLNHQHFVLEPHGTVDRPWTESGRFDEILELSLDVRLPSLAFKLLPGPEPADITNTRPYVEARTHLRTAHAVVVIGYSFGRFNGKKDDAESFEYLLDALGNRRCPIFIVDPNADWYASDFEDRLHRRVFSVPLRWDHFSSIATALINPGVGLTSLLRDRTLNTLVAAYQRSSDHSE